VLTLHALTRKNENERNSRFQYAVHGIIKHAYAERRLNIMGKQGSSSRQMRINSATVICYSGVKYFDVKRLMYRNITSIYCNLYQSNAMEAKESIKYL